VTSGSTSGRGENQLLRIVYIMLLFLCLSSCREEIFDVILLSS